MLGKLGKQLVLTPCRALAAGCKKSSTPLLADRRCFSFSSGRWLSIAISFIAIRSVPNLVIIQPVSWNGSADLRGAREHRARFFAAFV